MLNSSQGSGGSELPQNGRAFGLLLKLSEIPTASKSSRSTGRESTDAERSGTSPTGTTGQLPLFPEGHPVSRPVLPGSAEAATMTVGSGRNLLALLNGFYRPGCWQRTLLESLVLKTGWRSRNGLLAWKLKTMRSSHRLFIQLQHSVPTTGDIESSLLPTLVASEMTRGKSTKSGQKHPRTPPLRYLLPTLMESDGDSAGGPNANHLMLNKIAKLLPTLTASTATLADMEQARYAGSDPRRPSYETAKLLPTLTGSSYGTNQGGAMGRVGKTRPSLQTMAKLLPTLRAGDAKSSAYQRDKGQKGKERLTLHGHARLLPTLISRDGRTYKGSQVPPKHTGAEPLIRVAGGTLDPVFCEWYMGFEDRWTDVE